MSEKSKQRSSHELINPITLQVYEKQRKSTITQRVLDYAQAEGIGFEELSSMMGLSSLDISSLYRGKRTLMAEEYVLLCDLLGVPPLMFM